MDDLLADFIAETRDMLRDCEEAIVAWEANPADRHRLDAIFRFVHTVKGNCGFFDLPRLATLSHAAETALGEVRAGRRGADRTLVSAVLTIIDRIVELIDALDQGGAIPEGGDEDLIAAVMAVDNAPCIAALPVDTATPTPPDALGSDSPIAAGARSIRLPVDLLDRVMSGVSDMVLARNDLARRLRESRSISELEGPFERLSGILSDVRESITRMRMNRIDQLYLSIPRLVRDLSNELGKQVEVVFRGGDVELDREIMELIRDPLTHLLRNAIDHGIEPPATRIAAGKPETGTLTITARHSGNEVHLTIADDGRGIDTARVAAKAVEAGIMTAAEADALSIARRMNLIFEPGLSTADAITGVSGRGVGMDVVRANLERIGGTIHVTSVPGERTVFQLKVPLTLSIVPGIIAEASGEHFAIPQSYIVEIVRRRSANLEPVRMGATRLISLRGRHIPYLRLDTVLALGTGYATTECDEELANVIIVLQIGHEERCAFGVDQISDYEDLVIKPLAPAIMQTGYYSGLTLLDNGRPILLLDVREIALRHDLLHEQSALRLAEPKAVETAAEQEESVLLFTALDGMECAIRFPLIDRIVLLKAEQIDTTGRQAFATLDGDLLPLLGLTAADHRQGEVRALCLSDGRERLVYAVAAIGDCVSYDRSQGALMSEKDHEKTLLVAGRVVRLLDAHRLFASIAGFRPAPKGLVCALPDDDWAGTILAPLLAASGYSIDWTGSRDADVAIVLDGKPPAAAGGHVIHLHSGTANDAGQGKAIDRYDRDRLLAELARIAGGEAA
jgi:two-component system chemotaxis sensor kinase CheA